MAALTDDGADVIGREINLVAIHPRGRRGEAAAAAVEKLSDAEFALRYDITGTAQAVGKHGAGRVALQMPDALLGDATRVQRALRKACEPGVLFFVMADTVFAPCCVDEITAEHCFSDMIVKYGHSCHTATSRVPVYFVPLHFAVTAEAAAAAMSHMEEYAASLLEEDTPDCEEGDDASPPTATLVAQPLHAPLLAKVWETLAGGDEEEVDRWGVRWVRRAVQVEGGAAAPVDAVDDAVAATVDGPPFDGFRVTGGRVVDTSRGLVVFGDEAGVMVQAHLWGEYRRAVGGAGTVLAMDIDGEKADTASYTALREVQKRLRVRHYSLEKIRDAEVVAIVVVSLAIEGYREVVEHLKSVLTAGGKAHIVVYVGKPNVAKLSNYEEVDAYCVLACPQTSWLDAKEYPKPVVTPMEVAVALLEQENALLTPQYYSLDLPAVLQCYPSDAPRAPAPETTQMSFITGSIRTDHTAASPGDDAAPDTASAAVMPDDNDAAAMVAYQAREVVAFQASPLVVRMQQRNYRGLEVKKGETEVQAEILPGLAGIASGYQSEPKTK